MIIFQWFITKLLSFGGDKLIGPVFDYLKKKDESLVRKLEIESGVTIESMRANVALAGQAAEVVKEGMQHRVFWIPWLIATIPLTTWFAWGVLDSMIWDALPDTLSMKGQLGEFATIAWQNLFYSGAAVKGAEVVGSMVRGLSSRKG